MDYKFLLDKSERRRYIRIPVSCIVKFEEFSIDKDNLATADEVDVKDLSAGGILIETEKKYELGDVLRVELRVPGWEKFKPEFLKPGTERKENSAIVALASVVRIEALSSGIYEIGVRLTGIDDGHRLALERFIFETVKEKKRANQDY